MGSRIVTLASLALGAAAQSTAGAYGQCKSHLESCYVKYRLTDFSKVVALATRDQALAALDMLALPISENTDGSEMLSADNGTDTPWKAPIMPNAIPEPLRPQLSQAPAWSRPAHAQLPQLQPAPARP